MSGRRFVLTAERPHAVRANSAADCRAADRSRLEAATAAMPAVTLPLREFEALPGGLTNRNYRIVVADGTQAVARISEPATALLAIDREAEFRNGIIAAEHGVGPRLLGYAPGEGVSVVEWIEGKTFGAADLDDSENLARLADACRLLHSAKRFVTDFDMFAIQRNYLSLVQEHHYRLPAGYQQYQPVVDQIRDALAVHPRATVPCHNDLLPANIMDDGHQLWLIDYEYAGNNDPCFELGNIASEAHMSSARLNELVTAYFGRESAPDFARARLFALMSNYGWTLWAAIQDSVSDVDFDFWAWGLEKYERAEAEFGSGELPALINDVQQLN
jgi:thiamine kinase-like enzyme